MQNNLTEQFPERYTLRTGETRVTHSAYARSLQSLKPIPKNLVQRTRYCVMVNSTIHCGLPYDNIVPDVMVVAMPFSRLPEMAQVAVARFASELEGSLKEPPLKKFIFANLIDHLACKGLLPDLPQTLRDMNNLEAARNEVARILHLVATAMEKATELLHTQLKTPVRAV